MVMQAAKTRSDKMRLRAKNNPDITELLEDYNILNEQKELALQTIISCKKSKKEAERNARYYHF